MTRNIVLLILDTVRKDYFDQYSSRLVKQSDVSFENCKSASTWSVPSHASIFTGEMPHKHHIHAESFSSGFSFDNAMRKNAITTVLDNHRSIGMSSNIYINQEFGFDSLFDEFYDHSIGSHWHSTLFPSALTRYQPPEGLEDSPRRYGDYFMKSLAHEKTLKSLANGTWAVVGDRIERLPFPKLTDDGAKANSAQAITSAKRQSDPYFMFVNYMDAHNPLQNIRGYDQSLHSVPNSWSSNEYDKWKLLTDGPDNDQYAENYRDLYGAAIDYLDRVVASTIDAIQAVSDTETTVIVTADHGHNLGYKSEERLYHHTASMSEGIMHVPLEIINPPEEAPEIIDQLFSQIELYRLIKAIAEDRWPDDLGEDWIGAESVGLLGEGKSTDRENADYWNRMIRCAYHNGTKYEWDSLGQCHRYQLTSENPCTQELIEGNYDVPDEAFALFGEPINEYKTKWEQTSQSVSFDAETEQRLKDLGYL